VENVYGGGNEAAVYGNTTVNSGTEIDKDITLTSTGETQKVLGAYITGTVYGAGKGTETDPAAAVVTGNTLVTMKGGHVSRSIYGGGELGSVGTFTATYAAGESTLHILPPTADSQTTPTDDYGINNTAGKSIIETHITTRLISSQSQERMVTKGLLEKDRYYVGGTAVNHGDTMGTVPAVSSDSGLQRDCPQCVPGSSEPMPESEAILRLKLEHANELRQLERDSHEREDRIRRDCQAQFDAERNRLMDIIERQNAELAKLYNEGKEGVK
jgi:hypothetical protein